jgi:hypothetical protein
MGSDRVICRSKAETQAPVLSGPLAIGGHFMDVGPVPRSVEKAFASRQPNVVDGTGGPSHRPIIIEHPPGGHLATCSLP